jgi:hypothetical protein
MIERTRRSGLWDIRWRRLVILLVGGAVYFLFLILLSIYIGRPATVPDVAFFAWLAVLSATVTYLLFRWLLGGPAVDRFINRVFEKCFGLKTIN